jgi:leucine-rich repeat protein SHOC2
MEQAGLEQIIEQAQWVKGLDLVDDRLTSLPESIKYITVTCIVLRYTQLISLPDSIGTLSNLTKLYLENNQIISLPDSIGKLSNLTELHLSSNQLTSLPESIGKLSNLTKLCLGSNQLTSLPESIGRLSSLTELHLSSNQLTSLPESIGKLSNLTKLCLGSNQLTSLPESIGRLSSLTNLDLGNNQLTSLPESIGKLSNLTKLYLENNSPADLSILKRLPKLDLVNFIGVNLPPKYWNKISEWKAKWLLDEGNSAVRSALIQHWGYEKICKELDTIKRDTWREYTLLEIKNMEEIYEDDGDRWPIGFFGSLFLLKMTCPSTQHIHILRVPPEMESAEAAITWVNHGIHPDEFAVQT